MSAELLLADDDAAFRLALGKALGRHGYRIREAASGEEAVAALASSQADVALLDLQLGDMDGLEVLRRTRGTRTQVIVVTGHGTIAAAVEAMRLGAAGFVQKPVDAPALIPLVEDALRTRGAAAVGGDLGMAGGSAALGKVREAIRRFAPGDETVLVVGESGAGKELVARALHAESPRAARPFVAFNCAQAHRELFDSELFGHVRGAFTGAAADHKGLFREAHGGTLFLDEVGELPEGAQAKLLRALETKVIRPLGGGRDEAVDVRVIAATNRDLAAEARAGRFRTDLLYRLHVLSIRVPPLRERLEDVGPIGATILDAVGKSRGRNLVLAPEAEAVLAAYDWPGNVRELANVLKRAAAYATSDRLDAATVSEAVKSSIFGHPEARAAKPTAPSELTLAELERKHILETFERLGGNVTRVAQALGIDRRTLQRKLKALGRDAGDD